MDYISFRTAYLYIYSSYKCLTTKTIFSFGGTTQTHLHISCTKSMMLPLFWRHICHPTKAQKTQVNKIVAVILSSGSSSSNNKKNIIE